MITKRADAEATVSKLRVPQREEKGDNKESGYKHYTNQGHRRGRKRVAITRADAEAIQTKGTAKGIKG